MLDSILQTFVGYGVTSSSTESHKHTLEKSNSNMEIDIDEWVVLNSDGIQMSLNTTCKGTTITGNPKTKRRRRHRTYAEVVAERAAELGIK